MAAFFASEPKALLVSNFWGKLSTENLELEIALIPLLISDMDQSSLDNIDSDLCCKELTSI
jgi:hypothetical protein